ncbi:MULTISPECIES: PTS sugar transporter subunit IIA [Enterococcus]|uniref:PTS EIIA type-1 domain-containing protein n=1 Tax=Enterococcus dispar ATCC 51266 TaxID=1139219 RepID=S1NBU1_9ENTE|nr:PTS glucose transporter subunit IIA [Enterococcus dispar]EOT40182.1 hypothetical protein OMK_02034 [Enterococcus dispar ATCC 51266]EOW86535.1 hypothetical protein I569_01870 [Enterococcus dispar ATCC 51266]MCU7357449.1 PTS glucose transporter subunit IIA [Enterococcus dispar]MDT2705966.1 PTS glucose transporter subunit IIA [Enterococcus dispar]OJG39501.1 hypothetical protein RV01_GL001448 [Enterococcus dispar]
MFFNKKKKNETIYNPINGTLKELAQVSDPVFSEKMMGDGFAVIPKEGVLYSPVNGTVSSVFPTKHAVGITTKTGLDVLIHIGIDTVELNGAPFEIFVKEGDAVTPETQLATINLPLLAEKEKESDVMIIFTNMDAIKSIDLKITGDSLHATELGTVVTK